MSCGPPVSYDRLDSWWVSELMSLEVTSGGGMCLYVQDPGLLTFESWPQSHSLNWMHNDIVVMTDDIVLNLKLSDAFRDKVRMDDTFDRVVQYHLSFADTVGTSETFNIGFVFYRNTNDNVIVVDAVKIGFVPEETDDTVGATDTVALHFFKKFNDVVTVSDFVALEPFHLAGDSIGTSDHGSIYSQGYFDHNAPQGYFAADYFGYAYTW